MSKELLLKNLGLDEETISNLNEENLPEVESKLVEAIKSKLFEKEEFYSSIDKTKLPKEWFKEQFDEGVKKFNGTTKSSIDKHFGITATDKSNFSEEEKYDVNKYLAKASTIYKDKISSANGDLNAVQDENLGLKKRLSELEESAKTLSEKFESELNEKLTAKEMETLALIDASGLQAYVPISINLIWDKVYNSIKNKYSVVLEGGITQIRKKDNPSFKIENPNVKGEYLGLKDALVEELKSLGAWKEKADEKKPDERTTITVNPSKLNYSEALKKKIQEEEEFFASAR
jgi:hypothetical protein